MYTPDDQDKVEILHDAPQPKSTATDPVIMAQEDKLILAYYETGPQGPSFGADEVAMVWFKGVVSHMFGLPTDEVIGGHPLAGRGLEKYHVHRVENSSWLRAMEKVHSVHPKHDSERFLKGMNHYIFTFHNSTFECLAESFRFKTHETHMEAVRPRMLEELQERD
ncbi:MAG: hypothetical protein KC900_05835 [Candidatus Omnitrophica bacterium]|nr:hypothetical protein [Candidatus Omnitrophota bacterium]